MKFKHARPPSTGTSTSTLTSRINLETLPVEVVNHILSYLVHPRSRLPGLTERQSNYDVSFKEKWTPDSNRHFANLLAWAQVRHPFHLVESYCAHLVKACNQFNLPFALLEKYDPNGVYPDLSGIIYRRLWLQTAPRYCMFCSATLSCYPYSPLMRLLTCEDCFYTQTLTLQEIERLYHIQDSSVLSANMIRGFPNYEWVLRVDVEALALKLYKTRTFHSILPYEIG
ncbi:hypothetical protein K458DRAFT_438768 [Lentithecium fluviatile CBS 122367]|uniref:Uncharacterized protein n=1 Tax=Lentithecium fluviatile CBS 122367 TaxID=1168545 RepID=A0A6G1JKG1_9PLEO|nr:hypothetical protein K458DRAFT_438768 [Lentithecium fluviatile CBS 122367]